MDTTGTAEHILERLVTIQWINGTMERFVVDNVVTFLDRYELYRGDWHMIVPCQHVCYIKIQSGQTLSE